jgi:hypothetical protein
MTDLATVISNYGKSGDLENINTVNLLPFMQHLKYATDPNTMLCIYRLFDHHGVLDDFARLTKHDCQVEAGEIDPSAGDGRGDLLGVQPRSRARSRGSEVASVATGAAAVAAVAAVEQQKQIMQLIEAFKSPPPPAVPFPPADTKDWSTMLVSTREKLTKNATTPISEWFTEAEKKEMQLLLQGQLEMVKQRMVSLLLVVQPIAHCIHPSIHPPIYPSCSTRTACYRIVTSRVVLVPHATALLPVV